MSKHMTESDRRMIEFGLETRKSLAQIGESIGKHISSVSRELQKHRSPMTQSAYGRITNRCVHRYTCNVTNLCGTSCHRKCSVCGKCNSACQAFTEEFCPKLNQPPYVCNGCPDIQKCTLQKYVYRPDEAQQAYKETLVSARIGFNLTAEELHKIDTMITPLILQGQSIHHAVSNHKNDIPVSVHTVYRLVDKSALKARNIDLPRKTRLKPRKGDRPPHKIDKRCRENRTFADFQAFMKQNPDLPVVEMDSVVGGAGSSKVLLTFRFNGDFMPAFLRDANTALSVIDIFNDLDNKLGHDDFSKLLPVILTDNGSEFSNPEALEIAPDGTPRTRIFYCDPGASYQKPHVERCHELYRRILPSGSSFDALTQTDINLVASHVNSYARPRVFNKSPIQVFTFNYGDVLARKLLRLLGYTVIDPDKIIMTPDLLKR